MPKNRIAVPLVGILCGVLLAGCGGGGSHGLSSASTCSEWGSASKKERDTYAESVAPGEKAEVVKGPEYHGKASQFFESTSELDEVEQAQKITKECEAENSTGMGPQHIGEV
jgi:hypothetical protein